MQKTVAISCLICILSLCLATTGFAHRVYVFAYVDAAAIVVECSFSRSQRVKHGRLTFSDSETGAILHEGITDAQGNYRFCPDRSFLASGHGITVLLKAGEGHQNTWLIEPEELQALAPTLDAAPQKAVPAAVSAVTAASVVPEESVVSGASVTATVDSRELEALIGKVLDARLVPIKQALARQEDSAPRLQDIIGGIGWILGLLGLATYLRYRPRP